jgi:hypothetical protein
LICHKLSKTQKPKVLSFAEEKLKNPKPEVTIKIKELAKKQR